MTDCPNCEYHKKRAQLWRDEAYKQAGHPLPESEWVGLTDEEIAEVEDEYIVDYRIPAGSAWNFARAIEAKLKEKNT